MRRIMMFNRVSADGYFAAADGDLNWVTPDPELDGAAREGMPETDAMLFGRRTYQMFESFWPGALEDSPTLDPHAPNRRSPELREMARWINETKKYVFSRTLKNVTWRNSELIPELDPKSIAEMKGQPGKNMIIFGSGSIVSQLVQHDLIDDFQFVVTPVLLGSGRRLIDQVSKTTKLQLVDWTRYKSGNVTLRYARTTE